MAYVIKTMVEYGAVMIGAVLDRRGFESCAVLIGAVDGAVMTSAVYIDAVLILRFCARVLTGYRSEKLPNTILQTGPHATNRTNSVFISQAVG